MGRDFELQPSSCITEEAGAQTGTLVCTVCYERNPNWDGPSPAHSPELFPLISQRRKKKIETIRLMNICLSWLVSSKNDSTRCSKQEKKNVESFTSNDSKPKRTKLLKQIILAPYCMSKMCLASQRDFDLCFGHWWHSMIPFYLPHFASHQPFPWIYPNLNSAVIFLYCTIRFILGEWVPLKHAARYHIQLLHT